MRLGSRMIGIGIGGLILAAGLIAGVVGLRVLTPEEARSRRSRIDLVGAERLVLEPPAANADRQSFPDPNAPGTSAQVFVDRNTLDLGVLGQAVAYTKPLTDPKSLAELREAIADRGHRGMAALKAESDRLALGASPAPEQARRAIGLWRSIAVLAMYEGDFDEAASWVRLALDLSWKTGQPEGDLRVLLGLIALRRGELDNCIACVGPSSCIFPIAKQAVHKNPAGSREAVRQFTAYLQNQPGDLRVRWLLNIAQMTLGEYPEQVSPHYLIPIAPFRSKRTVGRFVNVAPLVGLTARGPIEAGGSIFDDFNGDGLPDLFLSSLNIDQGAALFLNRGDGAFDDHSGAAGLDEQVYALNVQHADFDNDGHLDVLLLRGGWERPMRLSLLRNQGDATFEDVTLASDLGELIATESAAWGDYDNDGLIDLFVCGEYQAPADGGPPDPRNRCRLYHNEGHGKFRDVAAEAGVTNERYAKGAVWGDYDNDGLLDLFVASMREPMPNRLYHNEGHGKFRDVAVELGVTGTPGGFTSLFWDFDNDGRLDLFVSDYSDTLADVIADYLGLPVQGAGHPRLYHNLGAQGFREVSQEMGLGRPIPAMSVNCGDIDNDGYLDLYLGTGWMSFSGLVPNVMLQNIDGQRFEDVTDATGTGHLQKGHGISFADWDCDGDVDLFVNLGGGCPGDKGYPALFLNPGHAGRHWLKVKLVGTQTNRAALGAKLRVDLKGPDGTSRSIYRVIGNNGSFGGNSLVETIGLRDATRVAELTITWPVSRTTQTFPDLAADQAIEITEGAETYKVLHQPPLPSPSP
jgi:hypothetical protein